MTTAGATDISQTGATLSGSYSGVSGGTINQAGFRYGTSSGNLDKEVYYDIPSGTSGSFSKQISGLNPGTTYYYQVFIQVGSKEFTGTVKSFKTEAASTADPVVNPADTWLTGYEIPRASVSGNLNTYTDGKAHSTVSETYGTTKAYIYNTPSATQKIVTHTFSNNGKVLPTYTILYDKNKKCALWTACYYDATDITDKNVGRNEGWNYDPAISQDWQPNLKSSYNGGYSRGHQIASSDRQTTVNENKQTFYYSNMTPQVQTLNGGTWNTLEQNIQTLAKSLKSNERLYMVTGPIFGSGYTTTTDDSGNSCPVPTQYYKCIMKCTFDASGNMTAAVSAAYTFVHDGTNAPRVSTTVDEVEALTGFDFFANVPDSLETAAEATATNLL